MFDKKVSIIIPIFNNQDTVVALVNNLKKLDYKNVEFILVNDGSTDNSKRIIESNVFGDKRFRCFGYTKNKGVSYARNMALSKVKGEFVTFIDADDVVVTDYLQPLIDGMSNGASVTVASMNDQSLDDLVLNGVAAFNYLYGKAMGYVCNKMYIRHVIQDNKILFDETIHHGEDLKFNIDYYVAQENNYVMSVSNKKTYFYQRSLNKLSKHQQFTNSRDLSKVANYALDKLDRESDYPVIKLDFLLNYYKQLALGKKFSPFILDKSFDRRINHIQGNLKLKAHIIVWWFLSKI